MDEEIYWKGLLGALDDQSGLPTTVDDSNLVNSSIENMNSSLAVSSSVANASIELTSSKSIETVSAFVDVDLEDEQQYYFKYYKEYFEASYGSTPDQKGL